MIPEMLIDLVHRLMVSCQVPMLESSSRGTASQYHNRCRTLKIYWNSSEEYWNVLPDTIVYDYQSKNREKLP
ncbi:hypothetical protein T09_4057 [Trichinella sp. T9]|nr:hypothetical protein T09_4057 [Trichinella sp. T9]